MLSKLNKKQSSLKMDYNSVFSTQAGKRVMHDLLMYCGFFKPVRGLSADRNEERRNVALHILNMLYAKNIDVDGLTKEFIKLTEDY